jgi:cytochrome c biogenesis protein CcdA
MKNTTVCKLTPQQADRRGVLWIAGAFVLCPCHLPITLWVIGAALSGTALGAIVSGHLYLSGAVISTTWLVATLHGFDLMRRTRRDATADAKPHTLLRTER